MKNFKNNDATALIWEFGIPTHLKGYKYILDSVDIATKDKQILGALCKELYPTIAKMNRTSPTSVEKGIRDAIKAAWNRVNDENCDLFESFPDKWINKKPTNKDFIKTIINKSESKEYREKSKNILH
jgi:two-component system response regulator (stage 0 sporulation protein A)